MCVCARACMCVCFHIILHVNCFGGTVLCMWSKCHIEVNMYHVSTQGVDARMINIHYCYKTAAEGVF